MDTYIRALRPATEPGEDRNTARIRYRVNHGGAAPGHRAGRGSQRSPRGRGRCASPRAAPGHRAGRGSQPDAEGTHQPNHRRCARPPRRARIATHRPEQASVHPRLRPATEPGEDRNTESSQRAAVHVCQAAPGHRAGRGSQQRAVRRRRIPEATLRPATAPGEDRNGSSTVHLRDSAEAAPGHRAGRGSQLTLEQVIAVDDAGCARPPRRARIATSHLRSGRCGETAGCARPPRRARIATCCGSGGTGPRATAAPGHRAGRGSQLDLDEGGLAVLPSLRPATAPGEDRNSGPTYLVSSATSVLRPATEPGEDRNIGDQPPSTG